MLMRCAAMHRTVAGASCFVCVQNCSVLILLPRDVLAHMQQRCTQLAPFATVKFTVPQVSVSADLRPSPYCTTLSILKCKALAGQSCTRNCIL
jgi:hypothetical protein